MASQTTRVAAGIFGLLVTALAAWQVALACPFCSAVTQTLGEELRGSDVGVIARLASAPQSAANESDPAAAASLDGKPSKFEIVEVLKGGDLLGDRRELEVVYFGQGAVGQSFFIMGSDPAQLAWATPIALTEAATEYVRKLPTLPETGPDRLAFFQEFFEHPETMLAQDAYDEFAKAPYADVKAFRERMNHEQIVARIRDKSIAASRRRLYLTMLGVCGGPDDLPLLEEMIRSKDPELRTTLDAMIAAYLTLKGPDGMTLVEDLFFRDPAADFTDTYSALVALRFHGQEEQVVPRERLLGAFRLMLDRPQYADLVIPDLARWEDWQSMGRLIELFKTADDKSSWVRTPVIQFLRVCPLPEAAAAIDELNQIDPEAVKRASSFLPFATATAPAPVPPPDAGAPAPAETAAASTAVEGPEPDSTSSEPIAASTAPAASATDEPPLPPAPQESDTLPAAAASSPVPPAGETAPAAVATTEVPGDDTLGLAGSAAAAGNAPPGPTPASTPAHLSRAGLLAIAGAGALIVLVVLLAIIFSGNRRSAA